MKAQEIALKNLRANGANNDRNLSLKRPSRSKGYGRVLVALLTLPLSCRRTQIQVAEQIGRPITRSTRYNASGKIVPFKYFSTHGAWATLSNAGLIAKINGAWSLTKLGQQYFREMLLG